MKPAIVVSTHTMGLGVIRSLGIMGVPVIAVYYDANDMGYVSKYVREKIRAPHPEREEGRFIDTLLSLAARLDGALLIPASDEAIAVVSRHKSLLEEHHHVVACTEWSITQSFIDKRRTYELAEKAGVPAPKTVVFSSEGDLERQSQSIRFPCLVKPAQSHRYYERFKTKMVQVDNLHQMLAAYREATDSGIEVMLQEIIPGDDSQVVNYNSYFWNGRPLVEFTARQIRKAPPQFGAPRVVISEEITEIIAPGRRILETMGFYGYSCTEFKKDPRDGAYKLMEVNGRHNRSLLLAVRCGLNFPWLQYRHLMEGELPVQNQYRTGVYWIMLDKDLICSLRFHGKERYPLSKYVRPYLRPHVFDVLDWKDLKPFVRRCTNLFKGLVHEVFRVVRRSPQATSEQGVKA